MPTRAEQIQAIRALPGQLAQKIGGLSAEQLTTPYNAPEWTIAQNVHHLADSHMNSFVRFKLLLLEDYPTIRPYNSDDFATTPDADNADVEASLQLLRGLHARWVTLLEGLSDADWERKGFHPERGEISMTFLLDYYAGHGLAHLQQIQDVMNKMDG